MLRNIIPGINILFACGNKQHVPANLVLRNLKCAVRFAFVDRQNRKPPRQFTRVPERLTVTSSASNASPDASLALDMSFTITLHILS